MSTTIDVYPSLTVIPTLGEFAAAVHAVLAEQSGRKEVRDIFEGADLSDAVPLTVGGSGAENRSADPLRDLRMTGDDYGWLGLDEYQSGFDFYFDDEEDPLGEFTYRDVIMDHAERARQLGTLRDFPFERAAGVGWL